VGEAKTPGQKMVGGYSQSIGLACQKILIRRRPRMGKKTWGRKMSPWKLYPDCTGGDFFALLSFCLSFGYGRRPRREIRWHETLTDA
ncbi:MAG TPA: hypothetical protein VGH74_17920, partial [Planctomycetaceae bacterium]